MKIQGVILNLLLLVAFQHESYPQSSELISKQIRIVQISDVQIGFSDSGAASKDSSAVDTDELYFKCAINMINSLNPMPDVIVNTGDMVQDPKNEKQWDIYLKTSAMLNLPVYETMGNHDDWSAEGIDKYKERFNTPDYYSFNKNNCIFIVLNSWYLKKPDINKVGSINQKDFFSKVLEKDTSKFKVVLLHFPLYLNDPEEVEEHFNLPPEERKWLLDTSVKNNIGLILSGHTHRNITSNYKDSVTLITTGSVSRPLGKNMDGSASIRGFQIIDINTETGNLTHQYVQIPEIVN